MGLLKNLVKGMSEDKELLKSKIKEEEQNRKVQRILDEREKSSNQRELERYMKEKHEEKIKFALDKIRKEKSKEVWKPKHTILKSDCNIMKNDRPILKEKNIFKLKKSMFID